MRSKLITGLILYGLSIALLILPTVILFIIRKDTYFIDGNETDITLGGMLGLVYILLLVRGAFKDLDKRFSTLIGMFVFLGVIYFLQAIMSDLFWIVLCGIIGYILYVTLSSWAKYLISYTKTYSDERARIQARVDGGLNGSV